MDLEVENRIDRSDEEGNLPVMPSGKNMNMKEEDMTDICCIGIKIYCYNDPEPENFP